MPESAVREVPGRFRPCGGLGGVNPSHLNTRLAFRGPLTPARTAPQDATRSERLTGRRQIEHDAFVLQARRAVTSSRPRLRPAARR